MTTGLGLSAKVDVSTLIQLNTCMPRIRSLMSCGSGLKREAQLQGLDVGSLIAGLTSRSWHTRDLECNFYHIFMEPFLVR